MVWHLVLLMRVSRAVVQLLGPVGVTQVLGSVRVTGGFGGRAVPFR